MMLTVNSVHKIIEGTEGIGGRIVDFLEYLNLLVDSQGFAGAMALLLAIALVVMFTMFSNGMKGLTQALTILTDKVSSPYLTSEQSIDLFRSIMSEQIQQELKLIGNILEKNDIQTRKDQIKININRQFKSITTKESERLSKYKSVCGDMGKTLQKEIDWKSYLNKTYEIFFYDYPEDPNNGIKRKISDIRTLMNAEIDSIAKVIEENGVHN